MRLRFLSRVSVYLAAPWVSLACGASNDDSSSADSLTMVAAGSSASVATPSVAGSSAVSAAGHAAAATSGAAGSSATSGALAAMNMDAAGAGSSAAAGGAAPATGPVDVQRVLTDARQVFWALPDAFDSAMHPVTEQKITLGRQLYYEKRLSKNQDLACNSCHDLAAYGVDARAPIGPTSRGHKGQLGGRNSPSTYNAAGQIAQFWDGRAADVEAQAQGPVLNPVEMALPSAEQAVKVLKSIPGYAPLFMAAFPSDTDPITFENAAAAIGAFERKLVTKGRFDQFLMGRTDALTMPEIEGLLLFESTGCAGCHGGAELGGSLYRKLGVVKDYPSMDPGRFQVTMSESDRNVFKVPTLRNIEKTAPYFHDGSVATLEQAVQLMAEYQTAGSALTDAQVGSIVTFLRALTGDIPTDYIAEPAALPGGPDTPAPDPS